MKLKVNSLHWSEICQELYMLYSYGVGRMGRVSSAVNLYLVAILSTYLDKQEQQRELKCTSLQILEY